MIVYDNDSKVICFHIVIVYDIYLNKGLIEHYNPVLHINESIYIISEQVHPRKHKNKDKPNNSL